MKKFDELGFADTNIHRMISDRSLLLYAEIEKILQQIKNEVEELKINGNKRCFVINGVCLSPTEFILLQARDFPGNSIRSFFAKTTSIIKDIKEKTAFLATMPGATIPPTPEELTEWLDEE